MRNLLLFMLFVAVFVLGSRKCNGFHFGFGGISGEGSTQTETRNESGFTKITLDMAGDVEFTQGDHFAVEVSAQQNLLSHIKTEVVNGELRIFSEDNLRSREQILIRVIAPNLESLNLAGSGNIEVKSALHAEKMSMVVGGSGNISSKQSDFGQLIVSVSGSGNVELAGKAHSMEADVSGSGEVDAHSLTSDTVNTSVSGSGNVTADVVTQLTANVSGSGEVEYTGSPTVNSSVSGSGSVQRAESQ